MMSARNTRLLYAGCCLDAGSKAASSAQAFTGYVALLERSPDSSRELAILIVETPTTLKVGLLGCQVGNSALTIVWHLLADPQAHDQDLGPDFYTSKINQHRRERDLVRQLEHLTGKRVILQPPPEQPAA
jgi:hypothetical protein